MQPSVAPFRSFVRGQSFEAAVPFSRAGPKPGGSLSKADPTPVFIAPEPRAQASVEGNEQDYCNWKFTVMVMITSTGSPFSREGSYCHVRTALRAASARSSGIPVPIMCGLSTLPSFPMMA